MPNMAIHCLHAGYKHATPRGRYSVDATQQHDHRRRRQHEHLYDGRHPERLAAEVGPQGAKRAEEHYEQRSGHKDGHRQPRPQRRCLAVVAPVVFLYHTLPDPALIFRIVHKLLANTAREKSARQHSAEGGRHSYLHYVEQAHPGPGKKAEKRHCGRRDRTRRDGLLRRYHSNAQRALGAYAGLACHLGYDRKHRVGHMARTSHECKRISHQRA